MTIPHDAYRRFQEELAALDSKPIKPLTPEQTMLIARTEFLDLQRKYSLTIADVIAFFPEEEGIAYLQGLLEGAEAKPARRKRKAKED